MKQKMNHDKLFAVHDDKLKDLLINFNLYDKLINSKIQCFFCQETLNWDNINAIFPKGGDIKITCDSPNCLAKLNIYLNEK